MADLPKPPKAFEEFSNEFPRIREAWDLLSEAGSTGPLDNKTARLIKLAVSIGAFKEGPTHSSVRKALAAGITEEEMHQVVALASSVIGLPSAVAAFTWVRDVTRKAG